MRKQTRLTTKRLPVDVSEVSVHLQSKRSPLIVRESACQRVRDNGHSRTAAGWQLHWKAPIITNPRSLCRRHAAQKGCVGPASMLGQCIAAHVTGEHAVVTAWLPNTHTSTRLSPLGCRASKHTRTNAHTQPQMHARMGDLSFTFAGKSVRADTLTYLSWNLARSWRKWQNACHAGNKYNQLCATAVVTALL